jgi:signal transduction histidine kinase
MATNADPIERGVRAVVFAGDGEMAALMRVHDWAATPLGPVAGWPESLRTAVRIVLGSRYPMFVWWGRELYSLHNDAYRPMLGKKHPEALGQPAHRIWAEIWDVVGPLAARVMHRGQATFSERLLLLMERSGYLEETYFTFSYSPIPEGEGIGGLFCAVVEDTAEVLGERRLRALRDLAATGGVVRSVDETGAAAIRTLAENPFDLPFALLYLLDKEGRQARLAGAAAVEPGHAAAPVVQPLADAPSPWPFAEVLARGERVEVDLRSSALPPLPGGPWAERAEAATVLPIPRAGLDQLDGFLVVGISPRRAYDDDYRAFVDLVAGSIATAVATSRAYQEERRRAQQLAELDLAKTAFFSNVSHEFRTPLTLTLGPLEDLLARPSGDLPGDVSEALTVAHRNGLRLLRLVNSLLDFSRIEAGRIDAWFEPTDLAGVTVELASVFRAAIERAGLRLVVETQSLPEPVYVDRSMWEKIVLNLLSNAFKFTLDGEIDVWVRPAASGAAVELCVRDTGVGIPPEDLPHVFERFHRARTVRARTHEGTGIGLALVDQLVRLHGGSVAVESAVNRGTQFTVILPFGRAHLPAERVGAAPTSASTALGAGPYVAEALRWLPDGDAPPDSMTAAVPPGDDLPAGRIVVVDDNADMRDYLRRMLAPHWEVVTATDGEAALAAVRADPPDLVLSDVMMPRLDGFGLLRALRSDEATRDLPVILLSARAGEEAAIEGLAAGADDYLAKPFTARELIARIATNLKLARSRLEVAERERQVAAQLRRLARASLAITSSLTTPELLRLVVEQARSILGAHQAVVEVVAAPGAERLVAVSRSETYVALWSGAAGEPPSEPSQARLVRRYNRPVRSREVELDAHWRSGRAVGGAKPSPRGWLGAPLVGRDGRNIGLLYASDREEGDFTDADESMLVQFAQAAAIAVENASLIERAEAALRARDEYLAGVSHDLQSPLTTIKGRAQILGRRVGRLDPQTRNRLNDSLVAIDEAATRMSAMIAELAALTREEPAPLPPPEPLDLVALLKDEIRHHQATTGRHRLELDAGSVCLLGTWHPTDLSRVFSNLIENAIKYSPNGGEIRVAVEANDGWAVVRVRDDGLGIPVADLPHVFERFRRGGNVAGLIDGTGLGLAGAKRLVEQLGGQLEAESREGEGSTFTVRLPLPQMPQVENWSQRSAAVSAALG